MKNIVILISISVYLFASNALNAGIIDGPLEAGSSIRINPNTYSPNLVITIKRGVKDPYTGEVLVGGMDRSVGLANKYIRIKRVSDGSWAHIKPLKVLSRYDAGMEMTNYYNTWTVEGGEAFNELRENSYKSPNTNGYITGAGGTYFVSALEIYIYDNDYDNDGDGYNNDEDALPDDPSEHLDTDTDGTGNNSDLDDDGDGIPDAQDPEPLIPDSSVDSDSDGTPNISDDFPFDVTEQLDTDGDGIGNNSDDDDDGDGVLDLDDLFPLDSTASGDLDGDGIPDEQEFYGPYNGDLAKVGNSLAIGVPARAREALIRDGLFEDQSELIGTYLLSNGNLRGVVTGIPDTDDAFWYVNIDRAWNLSYRRFDWIFARDGNDYDGDGIPNDQDEQPTNFRFSRDLDEDGVHDPQDPFPSDPNEWSDIDTDGIGDNSDPDRDGDGTPNNLDAFPEDSSESVDADNDGIGDNSDPYLNDYDNDSWPDNADDFPNDFTEWIDSDGDGYGDNTDHFPDDFSEWLDLDGDRVGDNADQFPNDPSEFRDSDTDGVGDNADDFPYDPSETTDSDGDGVGDVADNAPNISNSDQSDVDGDGVGDVADTDDDNDGLSDAVEAVTGGSKNVSDVNTTLNYFETFGLTLYTEGSYNSYGSSERSAGRTQGRSDVTSSPSSYNLFTEGQYNSVVAERDALPTQAAYDAVVAERDARLTQAETEATVAALEAEIARLETEVDNAEMGRIVVGKLGIVEPDWAEGGFRSPTPSTNEYHGELYGEAVATNNDGSVLVISEGYTLAFSDVKADAYVFNVSPASGGLLQKGSAIPISEGQKVCISDDGNTLVVTDRHHSSNTGKVDIYSYTYGDWVLQSSLTGTSFQDHFGYSVAINESGDRIAVGATQNDPLWQIPYWWFTQEVGFTEPGYVSIYDYDGSNWNKVTDLVGSASRDKFGTSLDFNSAGDVLVVGAHRNDGQAGTSGQTGQVKIFTLNSVNSGWTQLGNTLYGSAPDQHFGFSVAIDGIGNTLAVGAPGANGDVEECGLVTIFEYDQNNGSWSVHGDPIHGDASHDLSGEAVDLSDDGLRLAIGAARHDGPFGVDSGQIRVFDYVNGSWTKNGSDIDGETDTHRIGGTIALSGDGTRLFSAERRWSVDNNSTSGPYSGRVRLFQDTLLYGGQSDYDSLLAERDALPTQEAYDAVVAERDALPTQSDYDAVVAERDALPTQEAYEVVVAERDAKFTLNEIKDLRPSSTMIEVQNGEATIQLDMHQSNDLQAWSKVGESINMTVPANADTKFFRHAFSSSDSTVETTLEFTFIGTNNHDFSAYYGNEAIISASDIPLYETGSDNYYLSTYQVIEWSSNTPIGGSSFGRPTVTVAATSSLVGHNLKIRFFKYDSDNANNFSSAGPVLTIDGDALAQQDQTVVSASGVGVASQLGYSVRVWKEAKP